jgi:hypothetical protein
LVIKPDSIQNVGPAEEKYDKVVPDLNALIRYLEQGIDLCRPKADVESFNQSLNKRTFFIIFQGSPDFSSIVQHFSAKHSCKISVEFSRTTISSGPFTLELCNLPNDIRLFSYLGLQCQELFTP